jgi:methionine synthase II (cobalamin-independent)
VDAVGPDRAVAAPGCGFASAGESKIISLESAKRKLANLATAVKEVRAAET